MDSDTQRKDTKSRNPFAKWWIFLAVVSIWVVIAAWPKGSNSADLPYSVFINQVKSGNVSKVRLAGSEISGNFIQPVDLATCWAGKSHHPRHR